MNPLDDPLRNAWVGCLWPILRNIVLTAITLIIAVVVAVWLDHWAWFIVTAVVLVFVHDRIVRRYWQAREDAARNRFFGIRD